METQFFSVVEILMGVEMACSVFFFLTWQRSLQKWSANFLLGRFFVFVYKLCAVDGISGEACNWIFVSFVVYLSLNWLQSLSQVSPNNYFAPWKWGWNSVQHFSAGKKTPKPFSFLPVMLYWNIIHPCWPSQGMFFHALLQRYLQTQVWLCGL